MKLKLDRIISIATLIASLVALVLVLKRPATVAHPQAPAAIAEHAQSFDQKMADFEQATQKPSAAPPVEYHGISTPSAAATEDSKPEVHINSDEISAVLAQSLGNGGLTQLTPDSNIGGVAPTIKDQQVSFDGDLVHGQFLTTIAGKDVWITVSGHIGDQDGYATFNPTEFKVGDLNVPVSLVNPALQKKLAEQRDRMKLPDGVGSLKVENGELVMQGK
ncbi:MAG TPA: hypothetical protein VHW45_11260 [Candidatus Sulfotelmatobacter sp.]|jgi:hypothetical protein|nr:hypothetical protein [Candidatus Sulfotelmatobacter sp.]